MADTSPAAGRSDAALAMPLIDDVDGRCKSFKRLTAIVDAFAEEIGGFDRLTAAQRTTIRNAAALQLRAEQLQGALVRGEPVDGRELVRLATVSRHLVATLKAANAAAAA